MVLEVDMRDILIRGLIIAILAQIFLLAMRRSQKSQMSIDKTGNKIVQYSLSFKVFSVFITVGGTVLVLILLMTSGIPVELADWADYLGIFILSVGLGSVLILEVFFSQVCINDIGISKKSFWTKDASIQWEDISKVSHSWLLNVLVIKSKKGSKITVSCTMEGVQTFITELKDKCPEVF